MGLMCDWIGAERVRCRRLCCESRLCVGAACSVLEWSCVFNMCVCVDCICLLSSLEIEEFHVGESEVPSLLLWLLQRGSRVRV